MDDVWPTAVRFVRVDLDFPVRERDRDAGYILFDYVDGETKHKGAMELIPTRDRYDREVTRVVVSIPDKPRHVEGTILSRLERKMREEHGPPAPPREKPKPKKPKSEDEDDATGEDKPKDKLPRPETGELPRVPQGELPR